jgi:hypothetical protein
MSGEGCLLRKKVSFGEVSVVSTACSSTYGSKERSTGSKEGCSLGTTSDASTSDASAITLDAEREDEAPGDRYDTFSGDWRLAPDASPFFLSEKEDEDVLSPDVKAFVRAVNDQIVARSMNATSRRRHSFPCAQLEMPLPLTLGNNKMWRKRQVSSPSKSDNSDIEESA